MPLHEAIGLDGSGWFTEDPEEVLRLFGGGGGGGESPRWCTADFEAGDVLVLPERSENQTDGRKRLSKAAQEAEREVQQEHAKLLPER